MLSTINDVKLPPTQSQEIDSDDESVKAHDGIGGGGGTSVQIFELLESAKYPSGQVKDAVIGYQATFVDTPLMISVDGSRRVFAVFLTILGFVLS